MVEETPPPECARLEQYSQDGARTASLCFALTLFGDRPLQTTPDAVLLAWQRFLELVPPGRLTQWGTETTAPSTRKPVTKATLGLLAKWLAKGASKRDFLVFSISDGESHLEAPRWAFDVFSHALDRDAAHLVHLALPIRFGRERADALSALARELFATGAFRSGVAGPCWRVAPCASWTDDGNGHAHAVTLAEAHPGIELHDSVDDTLSVGRDGIKNAGWLTLLDDAFIDALGGAAELARGLAAGVRVERAGAGVMLRAGEVPTLDASGGERAVIAKVAPHFARTIPRFQWLKVEPAEVATHAYRLRLAPWPEQAVVGIHAGAAHVLLAAVNRSDEAAARAQLPRVLEAIAALRGVRTDSPTTIEAPAARARLLAGALLQLYT